MKSMPAMAPFAITATLMTLALAGCSTGGGAVSTPASSGPAAHLAMPGRWMLAAPNLPPCGVEFRSSRGGQAGDLTPDGGCPGNLYLSRRWTLADGALTITSDSDETLAQLDSKGGHFEGRTADGTPLTLSPKPAR
jgi:hypothetical protein